jgi:hypothetical protein
VVEGMVPQCCRQCFRCWFGVPPWPSYILSSIQKMDVGVKSDRIWSLKLERYCSILLNPMDPPCILLITSAEAVMNSTDHNSLVIGIEVELLYRTLYFLALHLANPGALGFTLTELAVTALCSPPKTPPPTIKTSS